MIRQDKRLKNYCSEPIENIENYDKAIIDKEHTWDCHHRGEILPCGIFSPSDLKKFGLYWNRPASELMFIPHGEHKKLHQTGTHRSEETRRKISKAKKGNPTWIKGRHHSEETRRKISETKKRRLACVNIV